MAAAAAPAVAPAKLLVPAERSKKKLWLRIRRQEIDLGGSWIGHFPHHGLSSRVIGETPESLGLMPCQFSELNRGTLNSQDKDMEWCIRSAYAHCLQTGKELVVDLSLTIPIGKLAKAIEACGSRFNDRSVKVYMC